MKSRVNIFLSAVLLSTTLSTIQSMDLPGTMRAARWVTRTGQMLLGNRPIANAQSQLTISNDPDPFTQLKKGDQAQIITLLSLYGVAQSLENAAKMINSLAQVNKGLNQLINDPSFCRDLTKYLAYQFNSSNEKVWSAMQTECAKRNLLLQAELQKDLHHLCINAKRFNPMVIVQSLKKLLDRGADLNYVYENEGPALIIALYYGSEDLACALIESGANPLATDVQGKSALEIAVERSQNEYLIQFIKQAIAKKQTQ